MLELNNSGLIRPILCAFPYLIWKMGILSIKEEEYKFFQLPAPTKEELFLLATKIHSKVGKLIENLGIDENEQNQSEFEESLLGDISKISIGQKAVLESELEVLFVGMGLTKSK